ncbi:P-loop containing nucleoside triphosphate hydrolase protein [Glomus cerebriforme]|uniref:P-loop containing nucleoside triphosphate hydrolase protein n=1 Tax=Glomus cerebriforme TaxID=658196 RepID=A0A397S8L0_9GLOM|nr:P-loop containing nucleoside triphosphate hydrolase protein [Glomus cerebriforme]
MRDLILKPPVSEDIGSARCRVSADIIKKRNLLAGQWARIDSVSVSLYCRLWPASIPADIIQANNFISRRIKSIDRSNLDNLLCSLVPLKIPLRNVKEVVLSIKLRDFEGENQETKQLCELGFVWKRGSDFIRLQTIRNILNGMVICDGCVLSDEKSCLEIEILATSPPNDELFFTNESQISIVETLQSKNISCVDNEIDQISLSIQSFSLEDFTRTIPGLEKACEALFEVVIYPLLYSDLIQKLNIECPKGVLLYGPPGVGKTYLVNTIAKECNAKMILIHGPDVFGSYVGESEARLRNKFSQAKRMISEKNNPIILFIDELDALASHREAAQSHEFHVVAQLLTLMDGMESCGRFVVIAATNRPNAIDPALRRPGRFDREIAVDVPNEKARQRILQFQTSQMPLGDDVDIGLLAFITNGYVGADLASLCCEAAINAVNRQINCTSNTSNDKSKKPMYNVIMNDFMVVMPHVSPSIKHNFQVNFEEKNWDDIGGLDTIKKQLKQAVEWPLQYNNTFEKLGLKPPRGILLYGPPGCSKTTLVKVIASVSGAVFLSINGAQLYSPYVGDSEKLVKSIFQRARASNPSIIFLDEIDAIVGKRSLGKGIGVRNGYSVQECVLSMLLNEMDGIEIATSILVVGATNRPDMLDAALLRPGRFDRLIYVPPPDFKSRKQILKIHTSNMPLNEDVDLDFIAKQTEMYTGADLENLCRESAMTTLRRNKTTSNVDMSDFLKALKTVKASLTVETLAYYEKLFKFGIN